METMRKIILFFTILISIMNCNSSRDKCYSDKYFTAKYICDVSFLIEVNEERDVTEQSRTNAILINCLRAELQRKSCESRTNLDIRN
jgi:hypothetical protein